MHDPQVLLFEVPGIPARRRGVWEWPAMFTVWHVEPGGNDAGKVCDWQRMKWHVWHWKVRFTAWQRLRRRWLTKCAWCGGGSTAESPVNTCSWDRLGAPWWMGEQGMYHAECMMARDAHETCTCILPMTSLQGFICNHCGLTVRLVDTVRMRTIRRLKDTPYGVRPSLPVADPR